MLTGVLLTAVAAAIVVVGVASAVIELALRNYHHSIVGSLAALAASPLVLIGTNLIALATDLVAASP